MRACPGLMIACAVVVAGCGTPERQDWENTFSGDGEDLFALDEDFTCLSDAQWTPVNGTRVANLLGRQAEAVAHAESGAEGAFPVGTVLSLFPDEAMVKRGAGFSADTADWEFVKLHVASGASVIVERGTTNIGNPGGSCVSCHSAASAHDFVCFTNESCAALPFFIDTDVDPAQDDPRCR